ncbi:hypothetical protein [Mycolicibacterium tusciae]|uniref:hypothetical protein n=1 Tax=Mycolicibacterium tusciae TaxID=75922 RepID=UPI0003186B5D|nr:hypothetical protein [Mycolicibacterium tusciae]
MRLPRRRDRPPRTQTRHSPPELVVIDAVDELLDWQPEVTTTLQRVIDQAPGWACG